MAEKNKVTESQTYILPQPDGSETKLTVNFLEEFDSKDFQKCMDEFIKIHLKKKKPSEHDAYGMPKVHRVKKGMAKKKELPDFDYFKKTSSEFLRGTITEVLDKMPDLLKLSTKQLEVNIDIIGRDHRSYYAFHEEKISGPSKIFVELSGDLLVGRIVAPKYFTGRSNFRFLEKLLLHEFRHQVELLRGVYKKEYDKYDKLKSDMIAKYKCANVGRLSMHTALCNLMSEGMAEYYVMRRTAKVDINMEWIRGFKESLKKLALKQTEKEALDYMEENLDEETGPTVYYCGKMMCYFIGLAEAKKKGKSGEIKMYVGEQAQDISKLNEAMNSNKKIWIDNLSKADFKATVELLNKVYYYKRFIKKYEDACKELGIDEKNMVLSQAALVEIRKEAKESFVKYLAAGKPKVSRLHLLKERIKHLFYRQTLPQAQPAEPQKQPEPQKQQPKETKQETAQQK